MTETKLDLQEWLNQQPLPEEIGINPDGSRYIPIDFIKPKLTFLSPNWNTTNFNHFFFTSPDGKMIISGSILLNIEYRIWKSPLTEKGKKLVDQGRIEPIPNVVTLIKRSLTGSATFDSNAYIDNTHYGQTCLSLCIVAAAKELGVFFGRDLNKEEVSNKAQYLNKLSETLKKTGKNGN